MVRTRQYFSFLDHLLGIPHNTLVIIMKGFISLASFNALSIVSARTFTVKNSCSDTVW